MKYNNEQLDAMAEEIDLVDYIGQTEELHRKGNKYFIRCPLHSGDNTPSLCINPDTNKWHCFGCGEGSSIYDWMVKYEKLSFREAVEKVAELAGTDFSEVVESESMALLKEIKHQKEIKNETIQRSLLDWNKDYFNKFSDELPEEWLAEDMTAEALRTYNIRIDHNANRIVYPVQDSDGNLIGVKGRTRYENFKELKLPKYINYYKVSTLDYFQGWSQAAPEFIARKSVVIFEGVKSCIKCYGWNIRNTVASETSDISEGQLKLLIRTGIPEIIIAWDSDQDFHKIAGNPRLQMLKKFTAVSVIRDTKGWLGEKASPADKGEVIFRELLERRVRL